MSESWRKCEGFFCFCPKYEFDGANPKVRPRVEREALVFPQIQGWELGEGGWGLFYLNSRLSGRACSTRADGPRLIFEEETKSLDKEGWGCVVVRGWWRWKGDSWWEPFEPSPSSYVYTSISLSWWSCWHSHWIVNIHGDLFFSSHTYIGNRHPGNYSTALKNLTVSMITGRLNVRPLNLKGRWWWCWWRWQSHNSSDDDDDDDADEDGSHNSSVLPLPPQGVAHTKRSLAGAYSVPYHTINDTILYHQPYYTIPSTILYYTINHTILYHQPFYTINHTIPYTELSWAKQYWTTENYSLLQMQNYTSLTCTKFWHHLHSHYIWQQGSVCCWCWTWWQQCTMCTLFHRLLCIKKMKSKNHFPMDKIDFWGLFSYVLLGWKP